MAERSALRALSLLALGATMIVSPLLFNGAFGWSVVVITTLALLALTLAIVSTRASRGESTLAIAIVSAFVLTALQALPLPIEWMRTLAPDAYEATTRAAFALGVDTPAFVPFSLDPGGTRERTLAALAIAAAFLAGSLIGRTSRTAVLRIAALSVLVVLVISLAHLATGTWSIYGVYELRYTATRVPSPMMNPNHLGGFCAFGAVLALGLAAGSEGPRGRAAFFLLSLAASALVFVSSSRGAIASLVVGTCGFAAALA
ncbi:MAG: hypothetical protein H5U40_10615 [Polyangiaceae bacterium]|nr:hypothetical protein [Polyangiaceae bacterium]